MNKPFVPRKIKTSSSMIKAIKKAEAELNREVDKQNSLINAAGTLVLFRTFGWDDNKIVEFYKNQEEVYDECGSTIGKSMIQMCSEEAGIDLIREESNVSWEDLYYLNPEFGIVELTPQQLLYMRMQQKKWCRAQLMAAFMLTAKRKYDFDMDKLGELFVGITEVLREYEGDINKLREQCMKEVGFLVYKDPLTTSYKRRHGKD